MTIKEAIEILEKEHRDHHSFSTDVIGKSMTLGIEALKRVDDIRSGEITMISIPLPGETEE